MFAQEENFSLSEASSSPALVPGILFKKADVAETFGAPAKAPHAAAKSSSPAIPHADIGRRFGSRLRELRTERRMTQRRMARDFGIDRSFISDVERGRKSISLHFLEVIALGMKIKLSDLMRDI